MTHPKDPVCHLSNSGKISCEHAYCYDNLLYLVLENLNLQGSCFMKQWLLGICSLVCALPAFAHYDYKGEMSSRIPYGLNPYMGVYAGYGEVQDMLNGDGQSAIERIAFGVEGYNWWVDRW